MVSDSAPVALSALNPTNDLELQPKYEPSSPKAVLNVKDLLLKKLPLEIVHFVIEYAEYWPCATVTTGGRTTTVGYNGDEFILRTFPLGYLPATTENGVPVIPPRSYPTKANVAHEIELSDAVRSKTSDIFSLWKAQSLAHLDNPCRKVVFTIKSRDQGWGSERRPHHGIYEHAYSWFDIGLERFQATDMDECNPENPTPKGFIEQFRVESGNGSLKAPTSIGCDFWCAQPPVIAEAGNPPTYKYDHPFMPTGTRLQSNRTANRQVKEHVIIWASSDCIDPMSPEGDRLEAEGRGRWTANGDFVRNLKVGDIITVWARCRFGGWMNHVEEVKIDVYWAV